MNESKIIPDNLQEQLFSVRDDITQASWATGDLTTEVIRYNAYNNTGATMTEIFKAVGSMVGKASRTIREYQVVSNRFSAEARLKYDVLAYGHFRIVATLDNAEEALQWAVDRVEDTGKPCTIDEFVFRFKVKQEPRESNPLDELLTFSGAVHDFIDNNRERLPMGLIEKIWRETELLDSSLREVAGLLETIV